MSGAAGIAAAKNRRLKSDQNKSPIVDCNSLNGTCSPKSNIQQQQNRSMPLPTVMENNLVDSVSLKILGPMPTPQVLKIHEQRLNRIDEQLLKRINTFEQPHQPIITETITSSSQYKEHINSMEEKIRILEEVIMNLQLTITNVQEFAMETNLAMMKIKREQEEGIPITPLNNIQIKSNEASSDIINVKDVVYNDEIVTSNIMLTLNPY